MTPWRLWGFLDHVTVWLTWRWPSCACILQAIEYIIIKWLTSGLSSRATTSSQSFPSLSNKGEFRWFKSPEDILLIRVSDSSQKGLPVHLQLCDITRRGRMWWLSLYKQLSCYASVLKSGQGLKNFGRKIVAYLPYSVAIDHCDLNGWRFMRNIQPWIVKKVTVIFSHHLLHSRQSYLLKINRTTKKRSAFRGIRSPKWDSGSQLSTLMLKRDIE